MIEMTEADLKKAMPLFASAHARALGNPKSSKAELTAAALGYIETAVQMGAPPDRWYAQALDARWHYGALWVLVSSGAAKALPAAEMLARAGASMDSSLLERDESNGRVKLSPRDNRYLAASGFGLAGSALLRQLGLRNALEAAARRSDAALAKCVLKEHEGRLEGSSKTAKGVLGAGDQRAKDACETLLAVKDALLAACGSGELQERARVALADASERLAVKSDETGMAVNPAKVKKSASKEQRRRIQALGHIVEKYGDDEDLIVAALGASGWLRETPALACVNLGGQSVMAAAMEHGSVAALKTLDSFGANIWLAAAQAGAEDACDWAMEAVGVSEAFVDQPDLSFLASMLMKGAWLDGAADPKARCLELAKKGLERVSKEYGEYEIGISEAMRLLACLERLSLEESLGPVSASQAKAQPARAGSL